MRTEQGTQLVREGKSEIEFGLSPYDTRAFGFPCAHLGRFVLDREADAAPLLGRFEDWARENGVRFAYSRIAANRLAENRVLESSGFRFIEYCCQIRLRFRESETYKKYIIGSVRPAESKKEVDFCLDLARTIFRESRYFLDPGLDPVKAGDRYANWIEGSLNSIDHHLNLYLVGGEPVGFCFYRDLEKKLHTDHLLGGVRPGAGMGLAWASCNIDHWVRCGFRGNVSSISAANVDVVNIYAFLGYRFQNPEIVSHRWFDR